MEPLFFPITIMKIVSGPSYQLIYHKAGENEEEGSKGAHKVEELSNKLIKGHIKWKNYPIN